MSAGPPRESVDPATLPAAARWVLAAETTLRDGELPPALRRDDDPHTPSRAFLLVVMLGVGVGTVVVLFAAPAASVLRLLAAPLVLALWAGKVVTIEPGRLAGMRMGPWLPAAGWWFGALLFLEVFLEGFAEPRAAATALEATLAVAAGLVAWGKARLDLEA